MGVSSIRLRLLSAMPAQSKGSVRPVSRGVASIVRWESTILSGFVAISRLALTRKLCANVKYGWNRSKPQPKTGTDSGASACGCSGASTLKLYALLQDKISNACLKSEDGNAARSQWRPSVPLFWAIYVRCLTFYWSREGFCCGVAQLAHDYQPDGSPFTDELTEDFFNRLDLFCGIFPHLLDSPLISD